jgi:hypothetical protein
MDGQRGNAEERSIYLDQLRSAQTSFGDDHTSRNGEIAVKPRVPYAAPVGLYADLKITVSRTLRNGSDLCATRVIMGYGQTREDILEG